MTDESGPHPDVSASAASLAARVAALEETVAELVQRLEKLPVTPPVAGRVSAQPVVPASPSAVIFPPGIPKPSAAWASNAPGFDLEKLIAGHWLNRIGIVAVAVGVSYFLKYAIDNDWIGPRGQVAFGILLGAALVASMPWFLKRGHAYFADSMAGLGAAILYLALWAGGSYYHLFALPVSFAGMAGVTTLMIAIAIIRNSQAIALLALLGGFASPALVSTGQDAQTTLFIYLAVLNAGVLPLAWSRDWRSIELPAFILTQIYFWGWYVTFYTASRLIETAMFAALFFSIFLVLPALRGRRTGKLSPQHVLLVPANAYACLLAFTAMLWPGDRWALTLVAVALAAAHELAAQTVPVREGKAEARLLLGGVALTIATLIVPIRLDGPWITLAWSIEGLVLIWTGFRARLSSVRRLAFVLFVVAGVRIAQMQPPARFPYPRFLLNGHFLAEIVTVACFATAAWIANQHRRAVSASERSAFAILEVAANVLAVWALTQEVSVYFRSSSFVDDDLARGLTISLLWTLYASGLMVFGIRRSIAGLRWQALALFGVTIFKVFVNDMALLDGFYRIASSIALGVVLLVVSFLYQRSIKPTRAHETS